MLQTDRYELSSIQKKVQKQNEIWDIFQGIKNSISPSKNSSELCLLFGKQYLCLYITTKPNLMHYISSEGLQYYHFLLNIQAAIFWIVREALVHISKNTMRAQLRDTFLRAWYQNFSLTEIYYETYCLNKDWKVPWMACDSETCKLLLLLRNEWRNLASEDLKNEINLPE